MSVLRPSSAELLCCDPSRVYDYLRGEDRETLESPAAGTPMGGTDDEDA